MNLRILAVTLLALAAGEAIAAGTVLTFRPARASLQPATAEYKSIWADDGARILRALERVVGASLAGQSIDVLIFEGISNSGRRGVPMRLRASYPHDVKRATLVHELGHRYLDEFGIEPPCVTDTHDLLSPVLAEVWGELWGPEFVTAQAAVEAARDERYRRSWARTLPLSDEERRAEIARTIAACRKRWAESRP